jgi:aryl carrier-like protein
LTPFTSEEALGAMGTAIGLDAAQAGIIAADWSQLLKRRGQNTSPPSYFVKLTAPRARTETPDPAAKPAIALRETLEAAAPGRRPVLVRNFVRETACRVLGLTESDAPADGAPLSDAGLDSLLAVELRNVLGKSLGMNLSATLLFDHPSVEALSDFLWREMREADAPVKKSDATAKPGTRAEGATVLAEIAELSDAEVELMLETGRR